MMYFCSGTFIYLCSYVSFHFLCAAVSFVSWEWFWAKKSVLLPILKLYYLPQTYLGMLLIAYGNFDSIYVLSVYHSSKPK